MFIAYMVHSIGELLRLQAKCAVLQIMNSALADNGVVVGASGHRPLLGCNIDFLEFRRQHAINLVVILTDKR